jgi:hypothetical protein
MVSVLATLVYLIGGVTGYFILAYLMSRKLPDNRIKTRSGTAIKHPLRDSHPDSQRDSSTLRHRQLDSQTRSPLTPRFLATPVSRSPLTAHSQIPTSNYAQSPAKSSFTPKPVFTRVAHGVENSYSYEGDVSRDSMTSSLGISTLSPGFKVRTWSYYRAQW